MKKTRVLLITHDLAIGGLQRVVATICKTIDRDKFECAVLCLRELGEFTEDIRALGIQVQLIPQKAHGVDRLSFLKVAAFIRRFNPDVIHTHNTQPFMDGVLGAICAFKMPTIVHTDHARDFPDKWKYMMMERVLSHFVYRVVGVSEHTSRCLVTYEGIRASKILTVPNGIVPDDFEREIDVAAKRASLGLAADAPVVGIGVRLSAQKGIGDLLDAFTLVLKEVPRGRLVIAGGGPLEDELRARATALGLDQSVLFLGARMDIAELLKTFDVYVLSSHWEGLPMVLLEALASGCPIVSTDVGGVSTAVVNERTGLLVPARDPVALSRALIRLLNDRRLQQELADNGKRVFRERFSAAAMTRTYERIYQRMNPDVA